MSVMLQSLCLIAIIQLAASQLHNDVTQSGNTTFV